MCDQKGAFNWLFEHVSTGGMKTPVREVMTVMKHFIGNSQETLRHRVADGCEMLQVPQKGVALQMTSKCIKLYELMMF